MAGNVSNAGFGVGAGAIKDLGIRMLVVSHVENATTIYAYPENQIHELGVRRRTVNQVMTSSVPVPVPDVILGKLYTARIPVEVGSHEEEWVRGLADQTLPNGRVRFKAVDFGITALTHPKDLFALPKALDPDSLPVLCQRYKMAGLKPKGREDGFSAADRESGAEWLRMLIAGRTLKARCHHIPSYKGGVMFEGEVGGYNVNNMSLRRGFAKPSMGGDFPEHPPAVGFNRPYNHDWDREYYEYRMPSIPKEPVGEVKKLKATQLSLESALFKRNREIVSLKDRLAAKDSKVESFSTLSDSIKKARELRNSHPPDEGQDSGKRIIEIAEALKTTYALVSDVVEKESNAEKAYEMFTKCQDQFKTFEDKTKFGQAMAGAKQAVLKYIGELLKSVSVLENDPGDLQTTLETDPLIPRPVIQVGIKDKAKRDQMVGMAIAEANSFTQKPAPKMGGKSEKALKDLCSAMSRMAKDLEAIHQGEDVKDLPDVDVLLKSACKSYEAEVQALKNVNSPTGQQQVMVSLAKAISACLVEKERIEKAKKKYVEIYELASNA